MNQPAAGGPHEGPGREAEAAMVVAELPGNYFEIYKIAVEMADRVSARRGLANTFFLTINTAVLGVLGARDVRWYLPAGGIILSLSWWALLKSYRDLNRAKFESILAMEDKLPARLYRDEWSRLHRDQVRFALKFSALRPWLAQYRELGVVERTVPLVFVLIYIACLVRQLAG